MEPTFRHEEVFPLIARVVILIARQAPGFVSHEQIVSGVLADDEGASIVAAAMRSSRLETKELVASNMVAWFSQQITIGASPWAALFDRERPKGAWAYRPKTAAPIAIAEDLELSAIEGEPRLFFHLRRERNPALRVAKLEAVSNAGQTASCEACGFVTSEAYPDLTDEIIEVHHRLPLSEAETAIVTKLSDLALLCPNCHRGVHRTRPMLSVEQFREQVLASRILVERVGKRIP